jgi:hypothetical protein
VRIVTTASPPLLLLLLLLLLLPPSREARWQLQRRGSVDAAKVRIVSQSAVLNKPLATRRLVGPM